jgi:hypothetical protein
MSSPNVDFSPLPTWQQEWQQGLRIVYSKLHPCLDKVADDYTYIFYTHTLAVHQRQGEHFIIRNTGCIMGSVCVFNAEAAWT